MKSAKFWQTTFGETKKVKNVYLAGLVQSELVIKQAVKDYFGAEIKKLPLPIIVPSAFPRDRLAKLTPLFGLAFSQSLGGFRINAGSPLGRKKITLIPDKVSQERKLFKFKKEARNILKTTSLILWGFIALYSFVFLSIFFQLVRTKAALSGWEKIVFTPSQAELERTVLNLNQELILLDKIFKKRQLVSPVLLDFIKQMPAGVIITDFNFSVSKKNNRD